MVGAGEIGCRYGSQLESWYRFLVDPDPYQSISVSGGQVVRSGVDPTVIAQRQDFLRSDSFLAVLMLSDQNDCSIQELGTNFRAAQQSVPGDPGQPFHLPRARVECATNVYDPCCRSCTDDQTGCPVDPDCASPILDDQSDGYGLRCWGSEAPLRRRLPLRDGPLRRGPHPPAGDAGGTGSRC